MAESTITVTLTVDQALDALPCLAQATQQIEDDYCVMVLAGLASAMRLALEGAEPCG